MIWAAIQSSIILLLAFCAAGILRRQSAAEPFSPLIAIIIAQGK